MDEERSSRDSSIPENTNPVRHLDTEGRELHIDLRTTPPTAGHRARRARPESETPAAQQIPQQEGHTVYSSQDLQDVGIVDEDLLADLIREEQLKWSEPPAAPRYRPRHAADPQSEEFTAADLADPSKASSSQAEQPADPAPHPPGGIPRDDTEFLLPGPSNDGDDQEDRRLSWSVIRGVRPFTVASDLFAIFIAALIAQPYGARAVLFSAFIAVFFGNYKLYRSRLTLSILDDLPKIFLGWLSASALLGATGVLLQQFTPRVPFPPDAVGLLTSFPVVALPLIVVGRAVAYTIIRRARASRRVGHRTLIMGAGHVGQQIADILRDHPEYGLNPHCYLDDNIDYLGEDVTTTHMVSGLPVLGGTGDLSQILQDNSIHIVVVAFSHMKEQNMVGLIRTCDRLDSELFVVPRLYELHQVEGDMDSIWGVPLIRLRRAAYRSITWPLKRVFDILMSGIALIILGIPMAIIALAVRLDGGPGVIFRQDRVGVDGRHVKVMKFRSMRPANEAESQTQWNIAKDNRITPLGRFIRKTSLDELPQLINILRGDMSIVGPRPERPHFVSQFQERYPAYHARHRVPCGLTGLAAVSGLRGDTSIEDRARFDNYYIQNWSLWLDIKIILRTVSQVLTGAGG